MPTVHLLDYVAGNVRSLVNAIEKLGYSVEWIRTPQDIDNAEVCSILKDRKCLYFSVPLLRLAHTNAKAVIL